MKKNQLILLFAILGILSSGKAQDWAQLEKFKKENSALLNPGPDENRVVFMGNSITIGWQQAQPDFFSDNPYINRGISGQTTAQMLLRFRQDVIDLNPKAVIILAGTNDIAHNQGPVTLQQIMDNIISMTELSKANDIAVVLCSVLPAAEYTWRPGLEPARKIPELNYMLKEYCKENNIVYVDYFNAMTDGKNGLRSDLGSDGVHPNLKGYEIMKPLAESGLEEALSR